jgi:hypothetical protein
MGIDAVEALIFALQHESHKRRRRRRWGFVLLFATLIVPLTVMFASGSHHGFPVGAWSGGLVALFAVSQSQRDAAKVLARFDDKRIVGPMTEALSYGDKDVAFQARSALIRMLPTLEQSDSALLNAAQRQILARHLSRPDPQFALAILKAFQQIGGASEIPAVEALASRDFDVPALAEVARHCLTYLRTRAEAEYQRSTLLRASSADAADAPNELLRPASSTGSEPADELLRASEQGEEPTVQAEDASADAGIVNATGT